MRGMDAGPVRSRRGGDVTPPSTWPEWERFAAEVAAIIQYDAVRPMSVVRKHLGITAADRSRWWNHFADGFADGWHWYGYRRVARRLGAAYQAGVLAATIAGECFGVEP